MNPERSQFAEQNELIAQAYTESKLQEAQTRRLWAKRRMREARYQLELAKAVRRRAEGSLFGLWFDRQSFVMPRYTRYDRSLL